MTIGTGSFSYKLRIMKFIAPILASLILFMCSCRQESILPGSSVTLSNTIEIAGDSANGTNGVETPLETYLGLPEGSLTFTTEVGDGIEYNGYLNGTYDIDLSENAITFTLVAQVGDLILGNVFRTFPAGTYDRYYFQFDKKHKIKSFTSSDPSVTLITLSNKEFMIEASEGYSFNPGTSFTITLEK